MIRQGENTRDSGLAYFTEEKFSFLNITALVKRVVEIKIVYYACSPI